ncbi:MAG: prepilin-type N-terminal cleavage/methylation domain-containing protein [Verrucomicrobiales bacterium]
MKVTLKKIHAGFSLVEMLVVIAVIGIIAAIAVPNIGKINDAAEQAKDRRNAQNLASVCASAQAAGLDFATGATDGDDASAVIALVVAGGTVADTTSPFNGNYFGVPNMSADDQVGADGYLRVENEMLIYVGEP